MRDQAASAVRSSSGANSRAETGGSAWRDDPASERARRRAQRVYHLRRASLGAAGGASDEVRAEQDICNWVIHDLWLRTNAKSENMDLADDHR